MATWQKTNTTGVRCRQHKTRRHGVKLDRYFSIRYRVDGRLKEEGLGWASQGWTERKSAAVLSELKANQTHGSGPRTLSEKRNIDEARRIEESATKKKVELENLSFDEIFNQKYYPYIQANRRNPKVVQTEKALYELWIKPVIAPLPLSKIALIPHLESIKAKMKKAGRSPRTVRYALDVIRQVFNYADAENLYRGRNPAAGRSVKRPQEDNRRNRSLSPTEATTLLNALAKHSMGVHDMALLSLHAGLRFGEITALKWGDVDMFSSQGHLKDTKSNKNRPFFLTDEVKTMFARRQSKDTNPDHLVFPDQNGKTVTKISKTFGRVVDKIFNKDVEDRRERVVFHTLRRTFATWLLNQGTSIYHIQKLLGHASITTTTRYLDADNSTLKDAVMKLQKNS